MMRKRVERTIKAGLTGVWVALAVGGCANVGQQGAQRGAATNASAASGASGAATTNPAISPTTNPQKTNPQNSAGLASTSAASLNPAGNAASTRADPAAALNQSPPLVYRAKRGDTLARVAQKNHCSVKQLLSWNGLKSSSKLKSGQVLRVASPDTVRAVNAAKAAAANATVTSVQQPSGVGAQSQSAESAAPSPQEAREVVQETARHANAVSLAWPANGRVVEAFQPGETRGIEIGGKAGDPVRAAADGKVMYAGTGLNSYGSLIIVQHNKDFLTAYSHNRKLLVKTGDIVRQGQQIAEMGDEDNSHVSLGFELRHDGKPIDPMPFLPQGRG